MATTCFEMTKGVLNHCISSVIIVKYTEKLPCLLEYEYHIRAKSRKKIPQKIIFPSRKDNFILSFLLLCYRVILPMWK